MHRASRYGWLFRISPLVAGLTIVALGASLPERAVSVGAAPEGKVDVAIGDVLGNNIFSALFIVGIAAVIAPLTVHAQIIRREMPITIGAVLVFAALGCDGRIGRAEAAILSILLLADTAWLIIHSRRETAATQAECGERPSSRPAGTEVRPCRPVWCSPALHCWSSARVG